MPFCPQCGVENPASARFCDQCGATLIPVPGQGAQPAAAPAPAAPAPAPAAPAPAPAAGVASAGPSTCPQCGTGVIPGEAFCDNCGASLLGATTPAPAAPAAPTLPYGGVPPQPAYPPPTPIAPAAPAPAPASAMPWPQPAAPAPQPIVTPPIVTPPSAPAQPAAPAAPLRSGLHPATLSTPGGGSVALPAAAQAVIGRADPVSNFFPEVDLTPHGALDNGVGRRHARIFVQNGAVFVEDMDSTNGSFLNGARLAPHQPQPLKSGDELRLGKLVLRVQL